jgi:ankyrin repeat protein
MLYSVCVSQHFIALVRRGATTEIAELVKQDPAIAQSRDAQGVSALMWSVYSGQTVVKEFLLSGLETLDVHEAAAVGDTARLNALLTADPSSARALSADGWTALHLAAAFGGPEAVALLLSHGADIHAVSKGPMQNQPLHAAVSLSNHAETIALLIQHGANVNAKQMGGFVPLHQAASAGKAALVETLLAAGADASVRCDRDRTPADYAEDKGHTELAARLRG